MNALTRLSIHRLRDVLIQHLLLDQDSAPTANGGLPSDTKNGLR